MEQNLLMSSRVKRYRRSVIRFILIIVAVWIAPGPVWGQSPITPPKDHPFYPGEKLTYAFSWNSIPAGKLVLEVSDIKNINGEPAYHFIMRITSNSFIDHFYRFRSRVDAYTDLEISRSLFYKKKEKAGKRKRNIEVRFDWQEDVTHYYRSGKKNKTIPLQAGSLDPLSVIYYLRLSDMANQKIIERPVTNGKKNMIGRVAVVRKETLKLESGTFDTYLLEPETGEFGGVFKKSKENKLQIWITADERRIPVKIKSKVLIGSITGELISIK